jgi:hypothetical protein
MELRPTTEFRIISSFLLLLIIIVCGVSFLTIFRVEPGRLYDDMGMGLFLYLITFAFIIHATWLLIKVHTQKIMFISNHMLAFGLYPQKLVEIDLQHVTDFKIKTSYMTWSDISGSNTFKQTNLILTNNNEETITTVDISPYDPTKIISLLKNILNK